ncbi:hypothetical protein [Pelosinus fermentans]|uniref:hypothetical protein n=1 Tax=Pelosinus fermentans TaxID=365349 RepID=UPI00056970D4|nr:hypothetical protein [Pelosinus fermentans]
MELRKEITSLEEQLQIATEQDKPGIIKAITELRGPFQTRCWFEIGIFYFGLEIKVYASELRKESG